MDNTKNKKGLLLICCENKALRSGKYFVVEMTKGIEIFEKCYRKYIKYYSRLKNERKDKNNKK